MHYLYLYLYLYGAATSAPKDYAHRNSFNRLSLRAHQLPVTSYQDTIWLGASHHSPQRERCLNTLIGDPQ